MLNLIDIEKSYGKVDVLRGLNMSVGSGEIYGFLGRNGAGKSTALQIIMGITRADKGQLCLFNQLVTGDAPLQRREIGYVAQEQHFYDWMTAIRIGEFQRGFYPNWDQTEFCSLLKRLEIPSNRKIVGLSGGMRAKLALSLALAHRPKLLLLDEPTAGMDPVARREFIDLVREQASRSGRTTLFSSHLIDEVDMAANKIGILEQGKLKYQGTLKALKSSVHRFVALPISEAYQPDLSELLKLQIPPTNPENSVQPILLQDQLIQGVRHVTLKLTVIDQEAMAAQLALIKGWRLVDISLEEIFVSLVSKPIDKQIIVKTPPPILSVN